MVNLKLNYSLDKIIASGVYMNNWKQRSGNSTFAFWKHKHIRLETQARTHFLFWKDYWTFRFDFRALLPQIAAPRAV